MKFKNKNYNFNIQIFVLKFYARNILSNGTSFVNHTLALMKEKK